MIPPGPALTSGAFFYQMEEPINGMGAAPIEVVPIPWGVHLTVLFLNGLGFLLVFPLLGSVFACLGCLGMVAHTDQIKLAALVGPLLAMASLDICALMLLGTGWFSYVVQSRVSGGGPDACSMWSGHPARILVRPLLLANEIFSIGYVLVWLPVKLCNLGPTSWTWLLFWMGMWAGNFSLRRWISGRFR